MDQASPTLVKYPYLEEAAIDGEAVSLLRTVFGGPWHDGTPVDLETIVYEHLSPTENLIFDDEAELPPEHGEIVLGKTLPVRGKILLNRALKDGDPGRARFTLAHEIGHWKLHRKLFLARRETLDLFAGPSVADDFEFVGLNRSTFPRNCSPGAIAREEWQANRFAIALLIDPEVLRDEFRRRFGEPPIARASREWRLRARTLRQLSTMLSRGLAGAHPPLREVFGLSAEAMAIALETRGYVVEEVPAL